MDNTLLGNSPATAGDRDAVHMALYAAEASERLWASQWVTLHNGKWIRAADQCGVGIVDPFLSEPLNPGDLFWLVLKPNTITGLKHMWAHSMFDANEDGPKKSAVEDMWDREKAWATKEVMKMGRTLDDLLNEIDGYHTGDCIVEYNTEKDRDAAYTMDWPRFWNYFEHVKKRHVPEKSHIPFTCSC